MIPVRVKFYGWIRDVVDGPEAEVSLPEESSIKDLVDLLVERYGPGFAERVLEGRRGFKSYVKFFLNEEEINDLEARLKKEGQNAVQAMVYVMAAMDGG
jgi:molybdopterin converting factor small subunit